MIKVEGEGGGHQRKGRKEAEEGRQHRKDSTNTVSPPTYTTINNSLRSPFLFEPA